MRRREYAESVARPSKGKVKAHDPDKGCAAASELVDGHTATFQLRKDPNAAGILAVEGGWGEKEKKEKHLAAGARRARAQNTRGRGRGMGGGCSQFKTHEAMGDGRKREREFRKMRERVDDIAQRWLGEGMPKRKPRADEQVMAMVRSW